MTEKAQPTDVKQKVRRCPCAWMEITGWHFESCLSYHCFNKDIAVLCVVGYTVTTVTYVLEHYANITQKAVHQQGEQFPTHLFSKDGGWGEVAGSIKLTGATVNIRIDSMKKTMLNTFCLTQPDWFYEEDSVGYFLLDPGLILWRRQCWIFFA